MSEKYSQIIKKLNQFQLSFNTKSSYNEGTEILKEGWKLLKNMKNQIISLETALCDCQDFVNDIENDLSTPLPKEDFVFTTKNNMLSYKGRDYIHKTIEKTKELNKELNQIIIQEEEKKEKQKKEKQKKQKEKQQQLQQSQNITIENINIKEINYMLNLPRVSNLNEIKHMFYYYNNPNDKINTPGIYCNILNNICIKVPFPNIVDSTKEYSRCRSIRCKYGSKKLCDEQRQKMAKYHNSSIRTCNFAHSGDLITKIGYPSRCATIPRFGDSSNLINDIKSIKIDDIKNLLLYGINDIFSSTIWFDFNKINNVTFSNIEYA